MQYEVFSLFMQPGESLQLMTGAGEKATEAAMVPTTAQRRRR